MKRTMSAEDSKLVLSRSKNGNYTLSYDGDVMSNNDGWCVDVFEKLFGNVLRLEREQEAKLEVKQYEKSISFVPHVIEQSSYPIFTRWGKSTIVLFADEDSKGVCIRTEGKDSVINHVGQILNHNAKGEDIFSNEYDNWTILTEDEVYK